MTFFKEKPKRKEKPKNSPKRGLRLIIIILLFILVIGLCLFAVQQFQKAIPAEIQTASDGDPLTHLCEFDTPLKMVVNERDASYITDIHRDIAVRLPEGIYNLWFSGDGNYVWGLIGNRAYAVINIANDKNVIFNESHDFSYSYRSPSGHYVIRFARNDNGVHDFVLYSAPDMQAIYNGNSISTYALWSPDESTILIAGQHNKAHLINVASRHFQPLELPSDTSRVINWIDDTTLLYKTPAGRLRKFDLDTQESTEYSDKRFEEFYMAGGIQHSPNLLSKGEWVAGFDSEGLFQIFDLWNALPTLTYFVDMDRSFYYRVQEKYIQIEYDSDPKQYMLIYPGDIRVSNEFTAPADTIEFSPDGEYYYYEKTFGTNETKQLVSKVGTDTFFTLEEDQINQFEWVEIENTSYILYSTPTPDGTHVFYLLQPDSKDRCKVGTFYDPYITLIT